MGIIWLALGFALWNKICQAHCRSGTVGVASHKALSFVMRSPIFSEMYCSDPMGCPTVIPGCHTSSPSSSMALGGIALFQTLVFPLCNWMPATWDNASSNNSTTPSLLKGRTRDTHHPPPPQALDPHGEQERVPLLTCLASNIDPVKR